MQNLYNKMHRLREEMGSGLNPCKQCVTDTFKKKSELERNDIAIYTYILHLTWKDLEFVALDGL